MKKAVFCMVVLLVVSICASDGTKAENPFESVLLGLQRCFVCHIRATIQGFCRTRIRCDRQGWKK